LGGGFFLKAQSFAGRRKENGGKGRKIVDEKGKREVLKCCGGTRGKRGPRNCREELRKGS